MYTMPCSKISFRGPYSGPPRKVVRTDSNYYTGCSQDPGFIYRRSLSQGSIGEIVDKYGSDAAAAARSAINNGTSVEKVEEMLKKMPKRAGRI